MAVSLTLTDGVTTYNLLTGTLKLRYQGWEMQSPLAEGETTLQGYGASFKFAGFRPITETFTLYAAAAATELSIRQAVATLDKLFESARMWHTNRGSQITPPRLLFNTDAEAVLSCMIYDGSITMLAGNGAQPTLSNNNALAILTLVRHPLWEGAQALLYGASALDTYGGNTGTITTTGTAPGRASIAFGTPLAQGTALTRVWFGLLPVGAIARTNFTAQWPLTSGHARTTPVNPMVNIALADADGIGANVVQTLWNTTCAAHTDMHALVYISLSDIDATVSHWSQWRGTYRILCRCKVGAATTAGIILGWGGAASTTFRQSAPEVVVSNTTYKWIDLGECPIPIDQRALHTIYIDHSFEISAERLSGAGELSLDYLVLMPSEHMIFVDNATVAASNNLTLWAEADYDDTPTCTQTNSIATSIDAVPDFSQRDLFLPVNGGAVGVVVAERSAQHTETDDINVKIWAFPRWRTYKDT